MPSFSYLALDAEGRELRGHLDASSESALESALRRDGRWLVEARAGSQSSGGRRRGGNRPVKRRVLIEFFLQLGMQLKAGIPIVSALGFGDSQSAHPFLQPIQQAVLDEVKSGRPLSDALAAHPRTFAPLVINLVRAAEASGQLAEACYQIREYYEWLDRLIGEVRRALTYPAFVMGAALAFVILMFSFVVPKFASLFAQLKMPLPLVTTLVMGFSHFLVQHGLLLLAGAGGAVCFWWTAPRFVPGFVRWRDSFKLGLPLVGDLLQLICVSRFARNLAVVFGAGISLLEALKLGRELAGNVVLAGAIDEVLAGVREGRKMHETMARHGIFTPLMVRMVEVGEVSGTLTEGLNNVAEYYQDQLSRLIKKRLALLEPLLIVFLIGVVGLVAIALILPIAELMNPQ